MTTEAGGTATFQLTLSSQPIADVVVTVSSGDTTEGTVAPASVTFTRANWNTPQTVTVTGVNDVVVDGAVAYTVAARRRRARTPATRGAPPPSPRHQHGQRRGRHHRSTPTSGLATTEAGGTATFSVVLKSQPTANVTITLVEQRPDRGHGRAGQRDIHRDQLEHAADRDGDGRERRRRRRTAAYTILTAAASSATRTTAAVNPADVSVTNSDNDAAGITVTPTSGLVTTEAGGTATFSSCSRRSRPRT